MSKFLSALCLLFALATFAQEPEPYVPQTAERPLLLAQTTDFLDNAFFFQGDGDYYTKEELRMRIRKAYDAGFRKIYFRGTGGVSYYPSKVRDTYRGGHYAQGANRLIKTIAAYDTVAEFVKACHELGMQIYYWEPIFDNSLYLKLFPGMPEYDTLGDRPCGDPRIKPEMYMEHRKNYIPPQNFSQTVTTLKLTLNGQQRDLTPENFKIYTAPHGGVFTEYTAPYQISVAAGNGSYVATISGLEINNPVIKFALEGTTSNISLRDGNAVTAYYANGAKSETNACVEVTYGGDKDRIHVLSGNAPGTNEAFGDITPTTNTTCIARFGDVERYAVGVLEYANPESRARIKAIVTELYERYPALDGITFSIRTHSLPCQGSYENLGYGQNFYGFSPAAVNDYIAKFGVDPRREPYDEKEFLKIRGKYLTQMLGEVAEIVHAHGGKLEMMAPVQTSTYEGTTSPGMIRFALGSMYLWWQHASIDDFFDITTWAKKGYVDNVIMLGTAYKQVSWSKKWDDEIARFRQHLAGTKTKLSLHFEIPDRNDITVILKQILPPILKTDLDELEFYEENAMYLYDAETNDYDTLRNAIRETDREITCQAKTK